ncbi:MAG: cell division protein [Rhodospirillaceae bacterium]|nr:cell division protein [Rhodospirillaceae bacterium]
MTPGLPMRLLSPLLRRSTDIPLDRDPAARTLPWIIAVMAFLATLALAGAFLLNGVIVRWSNSLTGTLTIQIPTVTGGEDTEARIKRVVALLQAMPGVARVRVLSAAQSSALVEPWLGRGPAIAGLPLPRLIDVGLAEAAEVDVAEIRRRVVAAVPGAAVEEHQKWLDEMIGVVRWGWRLALAIVVLIFFAAAMTIVFAMRTSLRIHRNVTDVLHLIGARDQYVAEQFQRHAFRLGFVGGLAGAGLAALVVLGIERVLAKVETLQAMRLTLPVWAWIVLATVPLAAAALAAVAARYTVLRGLARML